MTDNMKIWNAVQKTNPANTKKVTQRGGFTSICAQSQIMEATRQFGPIGQGWGYESETPIFHDNLAFVRVTLWHGDRANVFGPVIGGSEWKNNKGYLDSDAPKKATTDAITKLLSQLGFNADVFLGLFDDNKYVAEVTKEFAEQAAPAPDLIADDTRDMIATLAPAAGVTLQTICAQYKVESLKDLTVEQGAAVIKRLNITINTNKKAA
jgi:hypothetical protein